MVIGHMFVYCFFLMVSAGFQPYLLGIVTLQYRLQSS
jgi:hypothetical protein